MFSLEGITRRDQTPRQGTAEKPEYMPTTTDLLSLNDLDRPG